MTLLSIAELDKTLFTFATPRNVSSFGCLDDRACTGADLSLRGELFRFPDFLADGKHFRIEYGRDETHRDFQQVARRLLGFVFDNDVVDARLAGVTRLAVIGADLCERRELDRDVLDDVTEVSSFL